MKKEFLYMCGVLFLSVFVISCSGGGGDYGGNTVAFDTVTVSGSYTSGPLNSDICVVGGDDCDVCTTFNEDAVITLDVDALDNLATQITPSPVQITRYRVSFAVQAGKTGDAIPVKEIDLHEELAANSSNGVSIRLFDWSDKGGVDETATHSYIATVQFDMVEKHTDISHVFSVDFPVYLLNIADDCTPVVVVPVP